MKAIKERPSLSDMQTEAEKIINQIELKIMANPAYLAVVRQAVSRTAEVAELDRDEIDAVILATEEALTNVIRHSYEGPCSQAIIVKLGQIVDKNGRPQALEILIRDFGKQIDPQRIKGRDLNEIKPGGLGVHIIRSVMDEINYSIAEPAGMQLRMVKYLKGRPKKGNNYKVE